MQSGLDEIIVREHRKKLVYLRRKPNAPAAQNPNNTRESILRFHMHRRISALMAGLLLLSACGNSPILPEAIKPIINRIALADLPNVVSSQTYKAAVEVLRQANISLNADVVEIREATTVTYKVDTNKPGLTLYFITQGEKIDSVSLVGIENGYTIVSDLSTGAVTRVSQAGTAQAKVASFGYANFGYTQASLSTIVSADRQMTNGITALGTALPQCSGSVPANLLQARAQAQNDAANYQQQLGVAVAAIAVASGAVLVACAATVVTVGVGTPVCLAAATAYTAATINTQDKTRLREDANIRVQYSQLAIDQWKSTYASSNGCLWF